jgi:hypothetical protein
MIFLSQVSILTAQKREQNIPKEGNFERGSDALKVNF